MSEPLYVVGHKNPDTDAIASAIGYAALLRERGEPGAVAARQGPLRRETAYLLERFGLPVPMLLTDVRLRVADVMTAPPPTVHLDAPVYDAGQILQETGARALAVVDDQGRLSGVVGVDDFAKLFFAGLDPNEPDRAPLDLGHVTRVLGGRVLHQARRPRLSGRVFVAAMSVESMRPRIAPESLLVMGDREDAQRAAIEGGVGAIIVTGDLPISPAICELAARHDVTLISVPHHTYTTVRLLGLCRPVREIMRRSLATAQPDDEIAEVRGQLTHLRVLPVLDEEGRVIGVLNRGDLLRPARRRVALVDHSSRAESVDGLEEAEVVAIIDHHRLGDVQTTAPVLVRAEPVGSTSTIVAELFLEARVPIPPPIAGVMLGALLADTVLFRSPTSTPRDREIATLLAGIAQVEPRELGEALFAAASAVEGRSARELLLADFKQSDLGDASFGIGTFETLDASALDGLREGLRAEMERLRLERGYLSVLFMLVDLGHERTEVLVSGAEEAVARVFEQPLVDGRITLPGVWSRKKQVVPLLPAVRDAAGAAGGGEKREARAR